MLRVAIIGTEHDHAAIIARTLMDMDEFELVGYARVENYGWFYKGEYEKVWSKLKRYEVEEILAMTDLDGIVVETDDCLLVKYAQMAADRGFSVHMDKPGSQSVEDYEKMLSTLKKNGKIFSVGYMYRFNPAINTVKQAVKDGRLGKIHSVEVHMSCVHRPNKHEWLAQFKGGMMQFLGCHLVDIVYDIMGTPNEVIPHNTDTCFEGVSCEDLAFAVFKHDEALSFVKSDASEYSGFNRRQLVVVGDKGKMQVLPLEICKNGHECTATLYTHERPEGSYSWNEEPVVTEFEFDRYAGMMKSFHDRIISGEQGEYGYEYEARMHRILLAACGIECNYKEEIKL